MAQMPFAGLVASTIGLKTLYDTGNLDTSLNAANNVLEDSQQALNNAYLKTPQIKESAKAVSTKLYSPIGLFNKGIEMSGQGWGEIGKLTGIPYAEPTLNTMGQGAAMFGLLKAGEAAELRINADLGGLDTYLSEEPGKPYSITPNNAPRITPESARYQFLDENAPTKLPAQEAPIVNRVGNPYRTAADAQSIMENKGLADTHEVIPYQDGYALQRKGAQALVQELFDPLGLNKEPVTTEETPSINEEGSSNVPPNMVQNSIYQTSEPNTNITKQQITDFVNQYPQVIDKDRLNKATYKIQSEYYLDSIVSAAQNFITTFKEYSRNNPIIGKYGHKIYFEPDSRSIERLGSQNDAWIEYALHSTTSTAGDNYGVRFFDKSKIDNINNIESIIKDADGYYNEDGKTYYYKRVREGKKPNAAIVLEFSNNGKYEDYRYITQLPNRKEFSASSVKPATEDFGQKQSGGTPSPIRDNNIAHQNDSVNDLLRHIRGGN